MTDTKNRNERGEKIGTATIDLHIDDRLALREVWASGETGDGRKFEIDKVMGGLAVTLKIGDVHLSADLTPIVHAAIAATAPNKVDSKNGAS